MVKHRACSYTEKGFLDGFWCPTFCKMISPKIGDSKRQYELIKKNWALAKRKML